MPDEGDDRWEAAQEGAELLAEGRVDESLTELLRVVRDAPDNEYGFFFLGQAYYEKEDWSRALKSYVRALELSPEYLGARIGAGHALRMMGKHREALRMAREALALAPEDGDALYLMAVVCFMRGDKAEARTFLERFLATGPEAEVALEAQGMLQVLGDEVLPYEGTGQTTGEDSDGDEP